MSKVLEDMNSTVNQPDLTNIYRTPRRAEYIYFLSAHGVSTKISHILDHKVSVKNIKRFKSYKICSLATVKLN